MILKYIRESRLRTRNDKGPRMKQFADPFSLSPRKSPFSKFLEVSITVQSSSWRFRSAIHNLNIGGIAEQSVALLGGQLLDDTELFQVGE